METKKINKEFNKLAERMDESVLGFYAVSYLDKKSLVEAMKKLDKPSKERTIREFRQILKKRKDDRKIKLNYIG